MNTNHWLEQKLNDEHQRHMQAVAQRKHQQQALQQNELQPGPQKLLRKFRAEMSDLATRWQNTTVQTRQLQRQS